MLTQENADDLERVQKCAIRIILPNSDKNYEDILNQLELSTLKNRRQKLCLIFAQKSLKNSKMSNLFTENRSIHSMNMRNKEKYNVQFANTERLKHSPIIYMQKLLNDEKT